MGEDLRREAIGGLRIVVEDPDGARLPDVRIHAESSYTQHVRDTVADENGEAMLWLPAVPFAVTAEMDGFLLAREAGVSIRDRQTTALKMTLKPKPKIDLYGRPIPEKAATVPTA
jgi:hypothetical protein